MRPAIQTPTVEQEYETFDGTPRIERYYHWGRRMWITRELVDPGRRPSAPLPGKGYSALRRRGPG